VCLPKNVSLFLFSENLIIRPASILDSALFCVCLILLDTDLTECWLNAGWMLTECWLNVDWMLTECWLNVEWMSTQCRLNVYSMLTECWLNAHWMLTECWLNVDWMVRTIGVPRWHRERLSKTTTIFQESLASRDPKSPRGILATSPEVNSEIATRAEESDKIVISF
jgi:hypothetical protein